MNQSFEIRTGHCGDCGNLPGSVLYLSDLHFRRWDAHRVEELAQMAEQTQPSVILLGGDYAETKAGLAEFGRLAFAFSAISPAFAIAGNHDYRMGIERVKEVVLTNNCCWLENESTTIEVAGTRIRIDGTRPNQSETDADVRILLLHQPIDLKIFASKYHMALAGHLHGGQIVLWQTARGLYPGRLFYRWNILYKRVDNTDYWISKGLGDTLPFRIHCPKDVLLITFRQQPQNTE